MIHDFDTHYWLARIPDGWISAEDHASYEPAFQRADKIRIEPLSLQSIQAILCCDVPPGYVAFLRTDIHQDVETGKIARLGYILAIERGEWQDPGKVAIGGFQMDGADKLTTWDGLPIIDGFRAELCTWNGQVAFESSHNFSFDVSHENGIDMYKFCTR